MTQHRHHGYIRRAQRCVLIGLLCAGSSGAAHAAEAKIGYLDVSKAFDQYKLTVEADKKLEVKSSQKEKELKQMIEEMRKLSKGLEMLSDAARQERQRQLEEKARQLREFEQVTKSRLSGERDAMAKDILQDIDGALKQYAETHAYDIILNQRSLVYGIDMYDITGEFIVWLNSKYKP